MTPAKFVEGARLEAARCALEQTALPVEAIVERCGFGDPRRMRRSFRRLLRVSLGPTPRGCVWEPNMAACMGRREICDFSHSNRVTFLT
jgi:AraC-like DNA-binding protein